MILIHWWLPLDKIGMTSKTDVYGHKHDLYNIETIIKVSIICIDYIYLSTKISTPWKLSTIRCDSRSVHACRSTRVLMNSTKKYSNSPSSTISHLPKLWEKICHAIWYFATLASSSCLIVLEPFLSISTRLLYFSLRLNNFELEDPTCLSSPNRWPQNFSLVLEKYVTMNAWFLFTEKSNFSTY